jgi:predicted ester cyclase
MGLTPTGKAVTITGLLLSRIRGGKVVEEWERFDTLHLIQMPLVTGAWPTPA